MKNKQTILIIEDENTICNFISTTLVANDYKVLKTTNGREAISSFSSYCPDMDGLDVLKQIRSWSSVPIIIVSARDQEKEKVTALDLGADDYITKPFGTSELLARIRTAIRHNIKMETGKEFPTDLFKAKDLTIDFNKRIVYVGTKEIHLTQIEFKLIALLAGSAGRVLTYDYIIKKIWGPFSDSKDNQILRVNMANIRRKIEENPADPQYIFTEVGVGYRMIDEN